MKLNLTAMRVVALFVMTVASGSSMAQAYSVSNYVSGNYQSDTYLTLPYNGGTNFYHTDYYGGIYGYNQGSTAASLPPMVESFGTFNGSSFYNLPDVTMYGKSYTTFGTNHAKVSISGFDPVQTTTVETYCTTTGNGSCSGPPVDFTYTTNPYTSASAQSRWQEIYTLGGGSGVAVASFNVHFSLDKKPSTSSADNGNASFYWAERDFSGNALGYVSASYDAASDSYSGYSYDNVSNLIIPFNGLGALLNKTIPIQVQRDFVSGDAVYVDSFAQAYVSGNGLSDAEHTVTLTNLNLPSGTRVFAGSGANYGGVFSFSGGSGTVCTSLDCANGTGGGGGGGGGTPPVPEPETYALLLLGLATLGWATRRRRAG